MGKKRHGFFPNAADLVHFPRKDQSTPVLVPCPPHWISPLWEQEYRPKAEQMSHLKHEARTRQPLAHPCYKTKSVPAQWPRQSGQMLSKDHRAVPLPFLNHQGVNKEFLTHKYHTANSILTIPKPDFRSRATAVPLTSAKQQLIPSLLDSKHQYEGPLDSNHRMEDASGLKHLPNIFADYDHLPEDLTHLSQNPPSSKFFHHQAEIPFMGNRTMAGTGTRAFPNYQARATHKPVKSIPSLEAFPRARFQDSLLTTKHHPIEESSLSCPDPWSKTMSFKASDLDYWVQAKPFCKVLQPEHGLRETVSLLRCIDNRSKDPTVLLSNLNWKTRATTACPPCPQYWTKATDLPSSGPHHQASTTLRPPQNVKAPPSRLEDPCAKTASSPLSKAPLGSDRKAKDTLRPSRPSRHHTRPVIIPVCLNDCNKAAQDSQQKATALSSQKSISGSDAHVTHSEQTPGLTFQTGPSLVCHQHPAGIASQDPPEAPIPKGLDHLALKPVDLGPSTMSAPEPEYRATLPLSCELKATALPRNQYTIEPAASDSNDPQTILPTDHDNQEFSQRGPDSAQILTRLNSDCKSTYSPSPDDHQTEKVQNCHQQITPQDKLNQEETNLPQADHQATTLTDPDQEDKLPIVIKPQDKTDQVCWGIPPLDIEHNDTNPSSPDPQISLPTRHYYKYTALLNLGALVLPEPEWQVIMPSEIDHQGSAVTGQAEWETSPLSMGHSENLMLPGPEHQTTPPVSPNLRVIIPYILDHQTENTPDANAQGVLEPEQDVFTLPGEQECEVLPPGKSHQIMTIENSSHKAVTLPGLHFQDVALPEPEDQTPMPLCMDHQTEDALSSNTWVSLQTGQYHEQAVPLGTDNRVTTTDVWDHEATPTLCSDLMDTALPAPDHKATHPLSPDFWVIPPLEDLVSDANDESSEVRLERSPQGAIPPEDHQDTTLPSQDQEAEHSLSLVLYEVALPGLTSQNEWQSISDHQPEAVPDPSSQVTPPLDLHLSAKILVIPGQVTHSSSPESPSVVPSTLDNQTEAKPDVPNPKVTTLCLDEEETASASTLCRAHSPSHPKQPSEAPIACNHLPEAELSAEHPEEIKPGFQHWIFSRKKRKTLWHLNYIKPYTIEGGDVPEETVDDLIRSIPQKEIKNDVCRQIILKEMQRVSIPHGGGDQRIPLDYPVCLICVSWIPNGCPHVWGMKYHYEAQLLAIPVSLSHSEGVINVKIILQIHPTDKYSIFPLPSPYYNLHPPNSPESTCSDLQKPVSAKGKWLSFLLGKDPQPSQRPCKRNIAIKRDNCREESTSKQHRTFLKSVLDMFQKKQKRH